MPLSKEVLNKLKKFDTPTICNIIELFDVQPRHVGFMNASLRCNFPEFPPMVGYAATASFRSSAPPSTPDVYGSLSKQLELFATLDGPAVVVFQDIDVPPVGATFGEVMCSTYQAFGAAGLITSGAGRDLEQVRQIGFPVFTGSTICSHAYCHILHVGQPVHVGGISIVTGDLMHGDENGVTTIPIKIANQVAEIGDEFIQAERIILDYVRSDGEKKIDEFKKLQDEFAHVIANLKKRICPR